MQTLFLSLYQHLEEISCLQAYHYFALFDQVPQSHLHPESFKRKKNGIKITIRIILGTNLVQPPFGTVYSTKLMPYKSGSVHVCAIHLKFRNKIIHI